MAPKRSGKLLPAPAAHSEEESSSSEPLATEEEEGEAQVEPTEPPSQPQQNPSPSGSESGSGSASDSESDAKTPPQPATETLNSSKPKPPLPTSSKKRPNESEPANKPDSKKKKKKEKTSHEVQSTEEMDGPSLEKKPLFQRLWSDEDEVALLQGMVDFVEREGVDPSNRMNVFSEFVKKYISVDATQAQLVNKVRGMKKKFKKNKGKGKNSHGKNLHGQKAWELMKKLWNDDKNMVLLKSDNDEDAVENTDIEESMCLIETSRLFPNFVDKSFMKGLERIGERKRLELEEDWMKLKVAEMKVIDEQTTLFRKQNRLIIDALSSKD